MYHIENAYNIQKKILKQQEKFLKFEKLISWETSFP